jgi:hypothetical protein
MDRNTIDSQFEKEMKESEIEDQKAERRR